MYTIRPVRSALLSLAVAAAGLLWLAAPGSASAEEWAHRHEVCPPPCHVEYCPPAPCPVYCPPPCYTPPCYTPVTCYTPPCYTPPCRVEPCRRERRHERCR